jgi:hypothetical protein
VNGVEESLLDGVRGRHVVSNARNSAELGRVLDRLNGDVI